MISVSLCMIVKNEEDVLSRCLDSVYGVADEVIIVDTGSTDRTREIAGMYTDKIYDFPWIDDFSAARNFAFSKATMDYILWLDADDVLLPRDRGNFIDLKSSLSPDTDIVMMKYNLTFDGAGNPTFSNYRERLIRRAAGFKWSGPVHEVITPSGKIIYADNIAVSHKKLKPGDPRRNLDIMEKYIASGGELDPRQTFYYARELRDNARYDEAINIFRRFLDDDGGWLENKIEACKNLAECFFRTDRTTDGLTALFRSFLYDTPRAEICCDIGGYFLSRGMYRHAAYWYEQARSIPMRPESGGFVLPDCYGYIPCLQLCVCYYRLGRYEDARRMNEEAAVFKPNDPLVIKNRQYFKPSAD